MPDVNDDLSASTQRFRAFAERDDRERSAPWEARASRSRMWILVTIVIVVVIVAGVLATVIVG